MAESGGGRIFFFERENALFFFGVLALLAIAFFIQPVALLVALAFGFLIPGWLLVKALRVDLSFAARLPVVVLASVLASTHAVYWVSLALPFGYSLASILASFALVSLLAFLVPPTEFKRAFVFDFSALKRDAAAFAGALAVFAVFFAVLSSSLWVVASDGSVIVGGWNYSDFFLHMGIIESVNAGNFPPQEPTFAGVPIAYHWFSDLHTAFLSKAGGVHAAAFARFETALYGALLFLGVYALAQFFFRRKEWCKRAAVLAAILFVFGGSFAYLRVLDETAAGGASGGASFSLEFLKEKGPFDNDWKFFQVPSLIPGFLLVQRPQSVGLPVLALALLLACSAGGDKRKLFLAGLLCGLAAPFQFYAFAAAGFGAVLSIALRFLNKGASLNGAARELAAFVIPCAAFSLPFVAAALSRAGGAGLARFAPFWLAPTSDAFAFAAFYAANLGLVFLLAFASVAFFALAKPANRFDCFAFLALFALALFAVPNLVSLSGTQWDMAKFFTFALVACAVLAAALIAAFASRFTRPVFYALAFAAIALASVTPVFSLYWYGASEWRGLSAGERAAGEWVAAQTPQLSVFLAAPAHNSAVDSVGGRLRIDGYSSWMNNYGLPYREREADLRTAYCGSAEDAASVARKYGARFVWLGAGERGTYSGCGLGFSSSVLFERVYDSGGIQIYELRD